MSKWLKPLGAQGKIFARDRRGAEADVEVFNPAAIGDDDWLLIHHSMGDERLDSVLSAPGNKALVYHNITPVPYLNHDAHLSKMARLGREQLGQFRGRVKLSYAVSQFNGFELEEAGLGPVKLLPLLDLSTVPAPGGREPRATSKRKLLFVGRIAPHKAQAELVKVLHFLRQNSALDYRLALVGSEDPIYGRYVRGLAKGLGLMPWVEWHSKVSDAELANLYRDADAFVSLSRHEGFGVPLTEAMQHSLPVFALWKTGVIETMGGAGVGLLTAKPYRVAEIVHQTLLSRDALDAIQAGQLQRWESLVRFQCGKTAQKALARLTGKAVRSGTSVRAVSISEATP